MDRLILRLGQPRPEGLPDILRLGLNPPELTLQRHSNLALRPGAPFGTEPVAGFSGPAETRLEIRLLVEAAADPESGDLTDVRQVTAPLHRLAGRPAAGVDLPCPIDLIWGKHWTFRGALVRLSERLDAFTETGCATRSWLQLEFVELAQPAGLARAVVPEPAGEVFGGAP